MKNFILRFFLFCFIFHLSSLGLYAASLTVSSLPSSIDREHEFSATVSLASCSGCSDSYLRGVFYPSSTSYFGFTQDNSGSWNNSSGSQCTTYFKVSQSELSGGSWSGTLIFKPDKDSSYYDGPGEYLFKVGRYTASCGSPLWSQESVIAITGPTPAPSPTPSPTPASTPTQTPKPTASPTVSPTVKPTLKPTSAPTLAPIRISLKSSPKSSVAGNFTIASPKTSPSSTPTVLQSKSSSENLVFKILLLIGGIFILSSLLFVLPKVLQNYFNRNKL